MARYSKTPVKPEKSASSRGSDLRVSFKNTLSVADVIKGWRVQKALKYLQAVNERQRAIPFRRHAKGLGRTSQGKEWKVDRARWPVKSVAYITELLNNAKANAEVKGLDTEDLVISHIQVNQAAHQRRRTYRAHGRINAYLSSPCHVEIHLTESSAVVPAATDKAPKAVSASQAEQLA